MPWVRRATRAQTGHACKPPTRTEFLWHGPDGDPGDLWRCDHCGELWRVTRQRRWMPATRWQRLRHAFTNTGRHRNPQATTLANGRGIQPRAALDQAAR